jgi:hypothetical protein
MQQRMNLATLKVEDDFDLSAVESKETIFTDETPLDELENLLDFPFPLNIKGETEDVTLPVIEGSDEFRASIIALVTKHKRIFRTSVLPDSAKLEPF